MNGRGALRFSRREGQVLRLACQGLVDKEIAAELGITRPTVRTYVSRLMVKTGATNRTQLGHLTDDERDGAIVDGHDAEYGADGQ